MRLSASVTLLVCLAGVGSARAQTDSGASPPPTPAATPDAGATPTVTPSVESPVPEGGPGLFEQSTAAAPAAPVSGAAAQPAASPVGPFTISGYVRGDMFAGKVNDQNAADLKSGYGELDLTLRT